MSAFDERVRGARARQILDDEVFKEAVAKAQHVMVDTLINIDPFDPDAPTMALRGVLRIQALSYVTQNLDSVMMTGEMAAEEENA
jgi:hypothetical protein